MQRLLNILNAFAVAAVFACMLPAIASAQVSDPAPFVSRGDVALGYNYIRSNAPPTGGPTFSAQGGFASLSWNWKYAVSAVGEASGTRASNISVLGQNLTLLTYQAGPRVTFHGSKTDLFAQALFGAAHGSDSYFPTATGYTTSANTFAWSAGGGFDRWFKRDWAIRAQAQYLHTAFPNGVNNNQNHLSIEAGIVYRFGGHFSKPKGLKMKPMRAEAPVEPLVSAEPATASPSTAPQARSATTPTTQPDFTPFTPPTVASMPSDTPAADASFGESVKDVSFDEGNYGLDAKALSSLSQAVGYLKAHPEVRVTIRGYDDASANFDLVLGPRRANAVREALVAGGIGPDRLTVVTDQSRLLNCSESDEACKQRSHRVEIRAEQ